MKTFKNSMGTVSFYHAFKGMRKEQDFVVYPMQEKSETIQIQSNTRIGTVNLNTGKVEMSKSRSGGSYGFHLMTDKLAVSQLNKGEMKVLKESIFNTGSKKLVGDNHVLCDNSGALNIFDV